MELPHSLQRAGNRDGAGVVVLAIQVQKRHVHPDLEHAFAESLSLEGVGSTEESVAVCIGEACRSLLFASNGVANLHIFRGRGALVDVQYFYYFYRYDKTLPGVNYKYDTCAVCKIVCKI